MTFYEDQEYKQLHIDGETLCKKQFTDCTFINCSLFDLTLDRCSFSGCIFQGCTCANLTFKSTDMKNNEFIQCSLIGISWDSLESVGSISLPFYKLEECVLKYNFFVKMRLKGFSFKGNNLEESYFEECNLENADFSGCTLRNAKFSANNLKNADFRNATGYSLDIRSNQIKKARFTYPEVLGLLSGLEIRIDGI